MVWHPIVYIAQVLRFDLQSSVSFAVRRARILWNGELSMIVYGADEALKWQLWIGKFFGLIR